ncbi:MAG: helix-turn-helix transcriptional regulator [Deltaproteobacteria bacterium]|nr:helix-turn-helix transcriptional regulator [Deltaproteobacteria bacterium]
MRGDFVGVIEAAYRHEPDDARWLGGLLDAARSTLDAGFGVLGYFIDAGDLSDVRASSPVIVGQPAGSDEIVHQILQALQLPAEARRAIGLLGPPETAEELYARSHTVVSASQVNSAAVWEAIPGVGRWLHPLGIRDLVAIKTVDLDRRGFVIAAPVAAITTPDARTVTNWARVAAHMAAGDRVRRALLRAGSPLEGAEAILNPDGRFEHAEGAAKEASGRAALRAMALAIEQARGPLRTSNGDEAVSMWTALVEGRWTLLEHFDRGGRRYIVAHRNEPRVRGALALSPREEQVAGYAALGHPVKLIAYELGLSSSTVSEHLATAMDKLGVPTRADLARVWAGANAMPVEAAAPLDDHERLAVAAADIGERADDPRLNETERGIVAAILRGESNAAIAQARGTSPRTVANQIARMFKKLGVGSRAELVAHVTGTRQRASSRFFGGSSY